MGRFYEDFIAGGWRYANLMKSGLWSKTHSDLDVLSITQFSALLREDFHFCLDNCQVEDFQCLLNQKKCGFGLQGLCAEKV